MKHRLLPILVCPSCTSNLDLEANSEDRGEIQEGTLSCRSSQSGFPIRKGVPRFVQMDEYVDTFSFEWSRFQDVQIDISNATNESEKTFQGKTGWYPTDLAGKRILDVGVGAGRFADMVSRWGGEVFGVDLSFAVDVAYYLTSLYIPFYYLYKLPFIGLALRFHFPISPHANPRWRWLDTFDWYSPKYQHKHTWPEVYGWCLEKDFENIRLNQETKKFSLLHINARGTKAGKPL